MTNNRTVILTGSGAAIPWGAPKTSDITDAFLTDRTFRSDTGQPLAAWIYHKLIGFYHIDPETVTFETIINALDYLNTFFSSKQTSGVSKFKNLMPVFFREKDDLSELLSFDRIYGERKDMWWESKNDQYKFYYSWNDTDMFFESIYRYFINLTIKQIELYAKQSEKKTELNNSLNNFLNTIQNPLRCYTINYDRIIPAGYHGEIFEGFTPVGEDLKFDLKRVLTDEMTNCHYNLHGSVHYEQDWPGNVQLVPDKYIYDFGRGASNHTDQDKRKMINSNIITGFNKTSRLLTNPYSQFYQRFYQDCLFADKIYIIGYSFGDIHINSAIKSGSLVNKDMKIICVDYVNFGQDMELETEHDWVDLEERGNRFLPMDFQHSIFESIVDKANLNRIIVYIKGYQKFLECKQWEKE